MRTELLSPFIYWAQDELNVFIKIDLKDIKEDKVLKLTDDSVYMDAFGVGAHGPTMYAVRLKLFDSIQRIEDDDVRHLKVTDRNLQLSLRKQDGQWWPRLLHSTQKPPWLKIDFERWKSDDDDDEDDFSDSNCKNGTSKDVLGDYPDLFEKLKKDEFGYKKEELKKVYLILYNLTQFVLFTYILVVMLIRYTKDGPDSMEGTFDAVSNVLKFSQLIQFLEVMHPMFGYTRGSVRVPLIQVTGRAIVMFFMIDAEPRMQKKPVVFYLFFIWSLVEVVRYPYYIAKLYKFKNNFLTWLRYSVWIPLYPLGIICEAIIILRNIPYFEETKRYSIEMPNSWNITFHTPTVMKVYLLLLCFPGMYAMMSHMYAARMKKLKLMRPVRKSK